MATFTSAGTSIELELFRPSGPGAYPAVVLLYGTRGMSSPFGEGVRDYAKALVDEGFVVAIPHYLNRTDTSASNSPTGDAFVIAAFLAYRDVWIDTIKDCITYVAGLNDVENDRIGLLTFSMGGHLGLRLAKQATSPRVKALVEFAAPITQLAFQGIGGNLSMLPPVQIHHGEKDRIVSPEQSKELVLQLSGVGKVKDSDYELYFYPDEGHVFESDEAIVKSTNRTITFLQEHV